METPQPLWATWFVLTILRAKRIFLSFKWNFLCFKLWSVPLVPPPSTTEKSLAPCALFPASVGVHMGRIPLSLLFFTLSGPSSVVFPHMKDAPVPLSYLCPFAGLSPRCPYHCCSGEPSTRHSRHVSPVLSRERSPPLTCWQCSSLCSPGGCWLSAVSNYL